MGNVKSGGSTNTTTTATATPQEQQLEGLQLGQAQAADPFMRMIQQSGLQLGNQLLTGQDLPGYLKGLPQGISPDVTNNIVTQSLQDQKAGFQSQGILDSGESAQIAGRTAGDIRNSAAQFNLNNLSQLLNLAVGGQAAPQASTLSTQGQLGSQLAGLRTTNSSGSTSQFSNPFLTSFYTNLGQGLGTAASGAAQGAASGLPGIGKFF